MLKTYRSLLAAPHARAFVLAGFVARLSISMRALGCVLMVSELAGSYGLAGAVTAALLLGEAVAAPRLGRLVDRYGQRRVLLVSLAVHSAGTLASSSRHSSLRRLGRCSPPRRSQVRRRCPWDP